jgi:hypothetical protein
MTTLHNLDERLVYVERLGGWVQPEDLLYPYNRDGQPVDLDELTERLN